MLPRRQADNGEENQRRRDADDAKGATYDSDDVVNHNIRSATPRVTLGIILRSTTSVPPQRELRFQCSLQHNIGSATAPQGPSAKKKKVQDEASTETHFPSGTTCRRVELDGRRSEEKGAK